jgi:hypothetical protein
MLASPFFPDKVNISKFVHALFCTREAFMDTIQDQLPITPLAIWSLVLGIVSLVFCCLPLAIPAIICGHLARSQVKQMPAAASGRGMAMAGLIMGYMSLVAFILACILGVLAAITVPAIIRMFPCDRQTACIENGCAIETARVCSKIFELGI